MEETFAAIIRASTPLVFAAMGELITEKSGVLNLGVEGIILVGALSGFAIGHSYHSLLLAVAGAAIISGLLSLLHGWISIHMRGNQIVSGLAIVILGTGLTGYFGKNWVGTAPEVFFVPFALPILSDIPVIGPVLFEQNALVYSAYLLPLATSFFLYRTDWGLDIRASGENPTAADAMGVNVIAVRYVCIFLGGALMGIAGCYLSLSYTKMWVEGISAGKGWIAIALVIFARWRPSLIIFGAVLFGGLEALQLRLQASGKFTAIPVHFLTMLPYIFTIATLVISQMRRGGDDMPAALGQPFHRE